MEKEGPNTTFRWPFRQEEISFTGESLKWTQLASQMYRDLMQRLRDQCLSLEYVMQQVHLNVFPLNIATVHTMLEECIRYDSPILGLEVFVAMREEYRLVPDEFTLRALLYLTESVFKAMNTSALPPEPV